MARDARHAERVRCSAEEGAAAAGRLRDYHNSAGNRGRIDIAWREKSGHVRALACCVA